ncbi:uncharacterized protein [Phyllobates terribilis]|uniref:uncharacterized protein n=1 Tax=Phyllobates terribilis TaxID=111132 RepID=UPI003CCB5BB2
MFCKTYTKHLKHLLEVFKTLINWKVKPSECHLLKPRVQYPVHVVSAEGMFSDPEKIAVVQKWPDHTTVREVRFLGFEGYYCCFTKYLTQVVSPLQELLRAPSPHKTRRNPSIIWTEELDVSFNQLKKMMTKVSMLAYPDYNCPFHV